MVRRSSALTGELAKVVAGRSELKLPRGDRRFLDPAWSDSWLYRRLLQAYLAVDETVDGVIDDAELGGVARGAKLRFIAQSIVDALAPANAPLVNPQVVKGAIDRRAELRARRAAVRGTCASRLVCLPTSTSASSPPAATSP